MPFRFLYRVHPAVDAENSETSFSRISNLLEKIHVVMSGSFTLKGICVIAIEALQTAT